MRKRLVIGASILGVLALGGTGVALATGGGSRGGGSRLDDGKDLLPQAKITEAQAIRAARTAASGKLDEVDLEHYRGRLVFNVDVGDKDVKVDADNGKVVGATSDD